MIAKEFFDLHEHLSKQLDECRGHQGPKAEPVNVPPPGEPTIKAEEPQDVQQDTMAAAELSQRSDGEW
eukprot:10244340-Prorocentrum_lima.AAC.1